MQIRPYRIESLTAKSMVFICVAAIYFLLGYMGLTIATINNNSSPVWPAAGFALGAVIVFGNWLLPAVFIGAALTNWYAGTPFLGHFSVGLGNTLEAYIAATIIRWFFKKNYFEKYSEIVSLITASFLAAGVGASIATLSLYLNDVINIKDAFYVWYTWWSGDIIGIFLIFPLFLQLTLFEKPRFNFNLKKTLIGVTLFAIMVTALYMVFVKGANQAFVWSLTPLFIIAGLRSGRVFSRVLLIFISFYIVYLTMRGFGPFEQGSVNRNLLYVQSLIASFSIAVLFVTPLNIDQKISFKYALGILSGWVSLFIAIYFISVYEKKQTAYDFNRTVKASIEALDNSLRQYELLLEGTGALLSVKPDLSEEDWDKYINSVHLKNFDHIINSIGFIKEMTPSEAEDFEKKTKIKIQQWNEIGPSEQNKHLIVTHTEPFGRLGSAKGWDLASEEIRKNAILLAKELKRTIISEPITLGIKYLNKNGFLIIHPVYNISGSLLGWSYVSVIDSVFLGQGLNQFSYVMNTKIFRDETLLYRSTKHGGRKRNMTNSPYFTENKITIFGKEFLVQFYPTDLFFKRHTGYSAPLALLLNVFILFITGFSLQQLTFGQRAEELVRRRTEELEFSKVQLVHSSKMASLGEMASGMAHEINNPLTIIQGKLQVINMLMEDLQLKDPMLLSEFNKIKVTTDRIGKIVKGLRNFSRVSENDPFEMILLDKLLHETLDLCAERFKSDGIDLQIDPIPEILIKCRPGEISQVLINLLNNSSDAVQKQNEKWIKVQFHRESSRRLIISITDSGKGIPQEIIDKIMDPFFTTKEVGKGTGLGLSISRGIIEAHGGSLRIDSQSPHTRFLFDLEYREV